MGFGPLEKKAQETVLGDVLEDPRYKGRVITYLWDLGANFDHVVMVTGRAEATTTMRLLEGKGKVPGPYPPWDVERFEGVDLDEVNQELVGVLLERGEESDKDGESGGGDERYEHTDEEKNGNEDVP